jgi:hypothetical protein
MKAHNFIDLTGKTFGFLTVKSQAERLVRKVVRWNCICSCGNQTIVAGKHLRNSKILSCGCYKRDVISLLAKTHGRSETVEYKVWCGMKRRCYNVREKSYKRYGGAGIKICSEWLHSFDAFFSDMGERPSAIHSIDRIDSTGNYEPGNCRWSLIHTQNRNRKNNVYLSNGGERFVVTDWAKKTGIPRSTISARLRHGWTIERTLTEPVRSTK